MTFLIGVSGREQFSFGGNGGSRLRTRSGNFVAAERSSGSVRSVQIIFTDAIRVSILLKCWRVRVLAIDGACRGCRLAIVQKFVVAAKSRSYNRNREQRRLVPSQYQSHYITQSDELFPNAWPNRCIRLKARLKI